MRARLAGLFPRNKPLFCSPGIAGLRSFLTGHAIASLLLSTAVPAVPASGQRLIESPPDASLPSSIAASYGGGGKLIFSYVPVTTTTPRFAPRTIYSRAGGGRPPADRIVAYRTSQATNVFRSTAAQDRSHDPARKGVSSSSRTRRASRNLAASAGAAILSLCPRRSGIAAASSARDRALSGSDCGGQPAIPGETPRSGACGGI